MRRTLALLLFCLLTIGFSDAAHALDRFANNGDGTVTDHATDLTWIQNPDRVAELGAGMVWLQAKDTCTELVYAGFGPRIWRLPNVNELKSIVDNDKPSKPKVDAKFFEPTHETFWSSTSVLAEMSKAYTVNFSSGELTKHPKLNLLNPSRLRVRCVKR